MTLCASSEAEETRLQITGIETTEPAALGFFGSGRPCKGKNKKNNNKKNKHE